MRQRDEHADRAASIMAVILAILVTLAWIAFWLLFRRPALTREPGDLRPPVLEMKHDLR